MEFPELAALASGHAEARAIQTALKLGIFETLASEEHDAAALARATGCDPRAAAILANALAALGLLLKRGGRYVLAAPARRFLVESSDEYFGDMILFEEAAFPLWAKLEESVRTGRPARTPDMFQTHPKETELFIRAMDSLVRARGDARYLARMLDLTKVRTIADIGGGPGTYAAEFVLRWPQLSAAIYDLPATLEVARTILKRRSPQALERIELVAVNYLTDDLPGPRDALFLSNVIHSEDETTNQALAVKCFRALRPGGMVIIKDHMMNRDLTQPRAGAIFSLHLLLTTRGRDYSFEEVERWLGRAGFTDIREEPLPSPQFTSSMVIARKP
jgi:SAM-dependent methyltransferase